jgi:hypothetical protein
MILFIAILLEEELPCRKEQQFQPPRPLEEFSFENKNKRRRCRGSNPGHPRDRREYLPLYYNDLIDICLCA